jgi:hypothetical protein
MVDGEAHIALSAAPSTEDFKIAMAILKLSRPRPSKKIGVLSTLSGNTDAPRVTPV